MSQVFASLKSFSSTREISDENYSKDIVANRAYYVAHTEGSATARERIPVPAHDRVRDIAAHDSAH